MIALLSFQL